MHVCMCEYDRAAKKESEKARQREENEDNQGKPSKNRPEASHS